MNEYFMSFEAACASIYLSSSYVRFIELLINISNEENQ